MAPMGDGSAAMPGATAEAAGSLEAESRVADAMAEPRVGRPVELEEQATHPEMTEGMVRRTVWPLSPQVVPLAAEEEDEVEEIEHEESLPQAIRILHKWGDEVVVIEEEDTTRELRRLESSLSTVMKQIKVSTVSAIFVFHVGDWSSS